MKKNKSLYLNALNAERLTRTQLKEIMGGTDPSNATCTCTNGTSVTCNGSCNTGQWNGKDALFCNSTFEKYC